VKESGRWLTVFVLISVLAISLFPAPLHSAPLVSDLTISIPGEKEIFNDDMPVIVRGLIHNISFFVSPLSGNITLRMYYSSSTTQDEESFYQWSYNTVAGVWSDDLYGRFIDIDNCSATVDSLSFHVGLATSSSLGAWTLVVIDDGVASLNTTVYVVDYTVGLAVQSVNTVFVISPFTTENKTAEYHVRVENKGNIPLKLSVLFGEYQTLFSVSNISEPLHVGEKRDLYVTLNAIPWSPRVVSNITGIIHPAVPEYLISSQGVSLTSTADQTFNLAIKVVREGYNLVMLGDTAVEYRDSITADYKSEVPVDLYLSSVNSTGSAELKITSELLDILSITVDNESSGTNMSLEVNDERERHVVITARPASPSTTAYLYYDIRDSLTGNRTVLKTEVVVLTSVPGESGVSGTLLILVGAIIGIFIITIIFITVIHIGKEGRKRAPPSSKKRRRRRI